ncbi:hypothetical protein HYC85_015865 [Camellia sinensis]|uniref:Senescence domain-containing protein n=1 Tax=Camellia sinensis TaxID=4442 RepID=A0A7J7GZ46_CAMSI|nr:hypothetical protein HYC85_015865 [Camellia sinensis]
MEEGEAVELDTGDFTLFRVSDDSAVLATTVKVGDLQWPLTKDEPVVKLDALHYLFSLPVKDGEPFSYGVTFLGGGNLGLLDSFLNEHSCFSCSSSSASSSNRNKDVNWKEYAPAIQNYNNFLAKAIAGGTGQIVKGIFKCSNAYTNQVQKGGEMILTQAAEQKTLPRESRSNRNAGTMKKSGLNKSLKRVRKISKMTEKMSKKMLDGVGIATGSVMAPVVRSQSGKAFLAMVPGEVLLASLDAVSKFGESAGEATEDVLATAGHCACAVWNIFKIRKTINPASSVSSGALRTARNNYKKSY